MLYTCYGIYQRSQIKNPRKNMHSVMHIHKSIDRNPHDSNAEYNIHYIYYYPDLAKRSLSF